MRKNTQQPSHSKNIGRKVKRSALYEGKAGSAKGAGFCQKVRAMLGTVAGSFRKAGKTAGKANTQEKAVRVKKGVPAKASAKFYVTVAAAAVAVVAMSVILCAGVLLPGEHDIFVNDAGRVVAASTTEQTVGAFLEKNGIVLGEGDVLAVSEDAALEDGFEIIIKRAFPVSIVHGSETKSIKMLAGTVQQALDMAGITLGEQDEVYPVADTLISAGTEITIVQVTEKTITEDEVLYFKEVTKKDNSLAKGKQKVTQEGQNGLERHTIRITYRNGVEVSRTVISSEVITKPVDEITVIGTYVAPKKEEPKPVPPTPSQPEDNTQQSGGNTESGGSTESGESGGSSSSSWGTVSADGKLTSVPTIAQIHQAGSLYEHNQAPAPDESIIAKTMSIDHVTAYTWTGNPTATGVYPKLGTIAACPTKFPYGTKVYVPGYGYGRVEDTGGFRGKDYTQFDLYMNSDAECRKWGRKRGYKVYILK